MRKRFLDDSVLVVRWSNARKKKETKCIEVRWNN